MQKLNEFLTALNSNDSSVMDDYRESNRRKIILGLKIRSELKPTGRFLLDHQKQIKKDFQRLKQHLEARTQALTERERDFAKREEDVSRREEEVSKNEEALTERKKVLDARSEMSNIIKSAKKQTTEIFN